MNEEEQPKYICKKCGKELQLVKGEDVKYWSICCDRLFTFSEVVNK